MNFAIKDFFSKYDQIRRNPSQKTSAFLQFFKNTTKIFCHVPQNAVTAC